MRYPRGAGMGVPLDAELRLLPSAQGEIMQEGERVAIVAVATVKRAWLWPRQPSKKSSASGRWSSIPFACSLPAAQLAEIARTFDRIVFVEEGCLAGGFASAVLERWADDGLLRGQRIRCLALAMPSWNTVPRPSCASWWACGHRISSGLCGN